MVKVSVIIASYNAELYVQEAIESVLSQTYKDIELIVVNDGSTDRTDEVVKSYDSKLKYICHDKNRGLSAARNTGIKHAKGKYIAFIDADDVWMPNKIKEQVRLFESDEEITLVFSNCYYFSESIGQMGTFFDSVKPYRGFVFENLLLNDFIPTPSVVVKKQILIEVGGFNERFIVSPDFDLYLRIAEHHKIDFVDSPLLKYRVHPDSLCSKKRKIMLEEAISITKFYRDKAIFNSPNLVRRLDKRITRYMFYIAIWSLDHTNWREAFVQYFNCIKTRAFDNKIALGFVFFVLPKFISAPLKRKLIKIQGG